VSHDSIRTLGFSKVIELVLVFVAVKDSFKLFGIPIRLPCSALEKLNVPIRTRTDTFQIMIFILLTLYFIQILFGQITRPFYLGLSIEPDLRGVLRLNYRIVSARSCLFRHQTPIFACLEEVRSSSIGFDFVSDKLFHGG